MGIFGLVVSFIGSFLAGLFKKDQTRKDQLELGEQRQRNQQLEADAEARRRVAEAEAKPKGDKEVERDLNQGTF